MLPMLLCRVVQDLKLDVYDTIMSYLFLLIKKKNTYWLCVPSQITSWYTLYAMLDNFYIFNMTK